MCINNGRLLIRRARSGFNFRSGFNLKSVVDKIERSLLLSQSIIGVRQTDYLVRSASRPTPSRATVFTHLSRNGVTLLVADCVAGWHSQKRWEIVLVRCRFAGLRVVQCRPGTFVLTLLCLVHSRVTSLIQLFHAR